MIPIVSLANLLNAVIAFMIGARIFHIERQLPDDNNHSLINNFAWFFFSFGFMWLFYALPGLFLSEISQITVAQFLGDITAFVAVIVGLRITFFVLKQPIGIYLSSGFVLVLAIIYISGWLSDFPLHQIETLGPYIYFTPTVEPKLQALVGVATSFGSFIFAGTFLSVYKQQKKSGKVARSALYLSIGMFLMFAASAVFFILVTPGIWAATLAAIFSLLGLVLLHRGIPYEGRFKSV
jgi:hypothetical protein